METLYAIASAIILACFIIVGPALILLFIASKILRFNADKWIERIGIATVLICALAVIMILIMVNHN